MRIKAKHRDEKCISAMYNLFFHMMYDEINNNEATLLCEVVTFQGLCD